MQTPNDPISKSINVDLNLLIYLRTPSRETFSLSNESIDRALAHVADTVHRRLEIQTAVFHEDYNHVVRIPLRLFAIVGEDVLSLARHERELKVMI